MKSLLINIGIAAFLIFASSCNSKPKVIEAESISSGQTGHTHDVDGGTPDVHKVVCQDFLHTDKYTYMEVTENDQRFWIAVPRKEVEKGAAYYYTGGLKKTNFKSTEYDRVFETIYLVSDVTRLESGTSGSAVDRALAQQQNQKPASTPVNNPPAEGVVKISELLSNGARYEGQIVRVKGRCVKINKMIMGRNWVHLEDG
ncbi:MAG TPA: hypothetical protein VI603_10070, partial [Saprospiraceae bacterium]|nr:hypothetical protein [Saprospiraceae bacterium]